MSDIEMLVELKQLIAALESPYFIKLPSMAIEGIRSRPSKSDLAGDIKRLEEDVRAYRKDLATVAHGVLVLLRREYEAMSS